MPLIMAYITLLTALLALASPVVIAEEPDCGEVLSRLNVCTAEKTALSTSVDKLQSEITQVGSQLNQAKVDIETKEKYATSARDEAKAAHESIKLLRAEIKKLKADLETSAKLTTQASEQAEAEKTRAAQEKAELLKKAENTKQQLTEELSGKLTALEQSVKDKRQLTAKLSESEEISKSMSAQLESSNRQLQETIAEREKLKSTLSSTEAARQSLTKELADVRKEASAGKGSLKRMMSEVELLTALLKAAEAAYLPSWSHSYYYYLEKKAQPFIKYHREEIMTGKAYNKANMFAKKLLEQANQSAGPYLAKAQAVVEPTIYQIIAEVSKARTALAQTLQKEPYKGYFNKIINMKDETSVMLKKAWSMALSAWNSPQVIKARAFTVTQKKNLERDLRKIFTHILGADVPGSGVDQGFVDALVSATFYAVPALLLLPLLLFPKKRTVIKAPSKPPQFHRGPPHKPRRMKKRV